MVFTPAQLTRFFEHATMMAIPHETRLAIGREGITTIEDLSECTSEELKQIVENLRRPSGRVPDPRAGIRGAVVPAGATIPTPAFAFSARSFMCLKTASKQASQVL